MNTKVRTYLDREYGRWLLEDFYRFCQETKLIYPISEQPHREMCEEIASMEPNWGDKTQRKKLFLAPRGSFKTSLITAFIVFLILKHPYIKILLYRSSREVSKDMLREVKNHMTTNPVILQCFGNAEKEADKWDEDQIIVKRPLKPGDRDATIQTIGVDGATVGFHPDIIFVDDVVSEQNCDSIVLMNKAWMILNSTYPLLQPYGTLLVTGTRWSAIDTYQRILDMNVRCIEAGDEPSYDEYIRTVYYTDEHGNQQLFFPSRLTQAFIDQQRKDCESRFFESWYFNRMLDPKNKPFKLDDIIFFDAEYHAFPYRYIRLTDDCFAGEEIDVFVSMIVDPSLTGSTGSDAYGITVCAFDANKNFLLLESREVVELPSDADQMIFGMLLTYQPDILIVESQGGDAALMTRIGAFIERNGLRTQVISYSALQNEVRGKRAKPQRIGAMEPYVRTKRVWARRGYNNELIRQLDLYPSLSKDDVIDSFAMTRHALKYVPSAEMFEHIRSGDEAEPDDDAITYKTKDGRTVTVSWEEYHRNPLGRAPGAAGGIGKGMDTGFGRQRLLAGG